MSSSDSKPVPTKRGPYYLASGSLARVTMAADALPVGLWAHVPDENTLAPVESLTWATDEHGAVVPVPTLEEWRNAHEWRVAALGARAQREEAWKRLRKATAERDEARRERDEARNRADDWRRKFGALRSVLGISPRADWPEIEANALVLRNAAELGTALLSALDVPEGADPVEWAGVTAKLADHAGRYIAGNAAGCEVIELVEKRAALRTPPRPLPDGPGWWWGRWQGATDYTPTWVEDDGGLLAQHLDGPVAEVGDADEVEWLAGPDGRAVRCTPPEVDRGV
jgi:hypothetical protein